MKKDDRLHPVITLTVYYGEKQWDGPYCLKDMIVEMPEEIAAIFSDYKMNLLEVRDSDRYVFNNTDVQSVFEITREIFAGHFEKIQEKYGNKEMGSDLLTVVGQMTGSKELIRMSRNMEVRRQRELHAPARHPDQGNSRLCGGMYAAGTQPLYDQTL